MNTNRARAILDQIEALQKEFLSLFQPQPPRPIPPLGKAGKRQMTEAGRAAISAAARRRWAAWRKARK